MKFDLQLFAGEKQGWSYSAVGNPEDLQKMAFLITPSQTPLLSAMGDCKKKVTNSTHSWTARVLRAPKVNAVVEGATITPADPTLKSKMSNYTQLSDNSYYVTSTENAIANINGTNSDIGSQTRDAMLELKTDLDLAMNTSATQVLSASGVAGVAGGLPYFLNTTNYPNATVIDAASKPLSETMVITAMRSLYLKHNPENLTLFCSVNNKTKVDGFTGGAVKQTDTSGKIKNVVKGYSSSFGDFDVLMSRVCPDSDVYLLDMNYLGKGFLQPFEDDPITSKVTKTAHKESRVVSCEWTMECQAVEAHVHIKNVI